MDNETTSLAPYSRAGIMVNICVYVCVQCGPAIVHFGLLNDIQSVLIIIIRTTAREGPGNSSVNSLAAVTYPLLCIGPIMGSINNNNIYPVGRDDVPRKIGAI
jgi:hypothetical protein